jgi:hypothetical protein
MTGWNAPPLAVNYTSGDVGTPRRDGAAGWGGGSRVEDRAGESGRCQPAAADDTELAVDPNWSAANWVTTSPLEHGDNVGGGLLDQNLGGSSGVDVLQDFGLPRLLLGGLVVLLLLLGHDPTDSLLLRFRRSSLRRHFLLASRKDGRSGDRRLGGGLGDLAEQATAVEALAATAVTVVASIFMVVFGREWYVCRARGKK